MDTTNQESRLRRYLRLAYAPPSRRTPPAHGPLRGDERSGLPGPLFDLVVIGLTVILAIGYFVWVSNPA